VSKVFTVRGVYFDTYDELTKPYT